MTIEKPCFTIRNGYWNPVRKCYKVKFPNAIELLSGDTLKLVIRVPRTIKGKYYEYLIPDIDSSNWGTGGFAGWEETVDFDGYVRGTEGCQNLVSSGAEVGSDSNPDTARLHCGWIEFFVEFGIDKNLGDVCEFEYSLCFRQVRLISKTKECECDRLKQTEQILYK